MRVAHGSGTAWIALLLIGVAASAGSALVAAPPADPGPVAAAVTVALDEWKLVPAPAVGRAGRVTFVVRNDGSMVHEFVVLRSDRRAGKLPVKGGKAVEAGRRGRIPKIAGGTSRRLTLTLRPGRYVLLCNLLGHYQAGQFSGLRIR